jgi:paired amphipathic helix protein Sin3a
MATTGTGTEQDFYARGGLEIKVCVRTYRLFYVSRTEDVLWRVPSSAESERASARLAERDVGRTRWLEEMFSTAAAASSFGRHPAGGGGVVAAASSSEAAAVVE